MTKFCELHVMANCPLCGHPEPEVNLEPPPPIRSQGPQNPPQTSLAASLPVAAPLLVDTQANAIIDVSQRYARACGTVAAITAAIMEWEEGLADSKRKLTEASAERTAAQQELLKLIQETK